MSSKRSTRPVANHYAQASASPVAAPPARTTAKATHGTRAWEHARLNSRFTFLIYLAVAVGTVSLDAMLRTTILWVVLALIVLAHVASHSLAAQFDLGRVQRGALIGLVLTLPPAFFAREVLLTLATLSLGTTSGLLIFQRMVFIGAPLDELYYRGCVQRDHGALEATLLYALGALVLYWPITQGFWAVLATMVLGSALLSALLAWVNKHYGLSAAIACHVACNLCLFVLPTLLRDYSRIVS